LVPFFLAWFCALKLELAVRYIMEATEYSAVYERGAGNVKSLERHIAGSLERHVDKSNKGVLFHLRGLRHLLQHLCSLVA
jgi:hypothetical protein